MTYIRLAFAAAILITIMGLGLVAYHYKLQATQAVAAVEAAQRDLASAVEVNRQNEATLAKLEADKIKSDKLAAELADEVAAANQSALDMATTLADLRATNVDVANYLRTPVPDALRGLYSGKPAAGDKNSHP